MIDFKNILRSSVLILTSATASFCLPLPIPPNGYELTNNPYFSLNYYKENKITSVEFNISSEEAVYESDFGIFSKDNPNTKLQIFKYNQEPGSLQSVFFEYDKTLDTWLTSTTKNNTNQLLNPIVIGSSFGYYFGVHANGISDPTTECLWYSDKLLNSDANGNSLDMTIDHVAIATDNQSQSLIYLDDQAGGGDRDWNDMIVFNDNGRNRPEPQSVPEPSTISLFLLAFGLMPMLRFCLSKKRRR
jgi:hypothetical protein